MVRVNALAVIGATLSLVGAATFWLYALLTGIVIGSSSDDMAREVEGLMVTLAALYTMCAVLGFLSQLAVLGQVPSLLIGLPAAWYLDYHPVLYVCYLVALTGSFLLMFAIFAEYSAAEKKFKAPPFSRIRTFTARMRGTGASPFSKRTARTLLALLVACPLVLAGFATYAWTYDVSRLRVIVSVNGVAYGTTNLSISVDGEVVYETVLEYDPAGEFILRASWAVDVTAGTHSVDVDAWNGLQLAEGMVDAGAEEKVLPFTTEDVRLLIGFGEA